MPYGLEPTETGPVPTQVDTQTQTGGAPLTGTIDSTNPYVEIPISLTAGDHLTASAAVESASSPERAPSSA